MGSGSFDDLVGIGPVVGPFVGSMLDQSIPTRSRQASVLATASSSRLRSAELRNKVAPPCAKPYPARRRRDDGGSGRSGTRLRIGGFGLAWPGDPSGALAT